MRERILAFVHTLRAAGVRVSVTETLDAVRAVAVAGVERDVLREALATTVVKDEGDRPTFDRLFDASFPLVGAGEVPGRKRRGAAGGGAGKRERGQVGEGMGKGGGRQPAEPTAATGERGEPRGARAAPTAQDSDERRHDEGALAARGAGIAT